MDASAYNSAIYRSGGKLNGRYYGLFDSRVKKIVGTLSGTEGILLDIGCGDGTITLQLKKTLGCEVRAVDLIQKNVDNVKKLGIPATQVDLNRDRLPFKDGSIDCVFAGEILEHVVDSEGLLLEMGRVLRRGGTLLLTVPNVASWYYRVIMLFGYLPHYIESGSRKSYGTPFGEINGHVKAFTKRSIVEMLEENGFGVDTVSGTGFAKTRMGEYEKGMLKFGKKLFFVAEKILSKKSSLATNIIIKAHKI